MRRKLASAAVVLLILACATCAFGRGYVEGAATAISDQAHGRNRIFLLGCGYWPRTMFEKRRDELLWQQYRLAFDAIGGIAPSRYSVQFQRANNVITWSILRARYGTGFIERVEARARRETVAP